MPNNNCNVIGCGMKRSGKRPNITLHQLPANEIKRRIWLETIGVENLNMSTKKINICSLHFEDSCFNWTLNKLRLSNNAVPSPTLLPAAAAANASASPDFLVCRVCLALDVKMFDMKDFKLTEMFQNITGISVCEEEENILRRVCWECSARLKAAAAFRNKALLSDALLKDIADLNKSDIAKLKHIYRSFLKSPLTKQNVFPSSDIRCEDTSPDHEEMELLTDETDCEDVKSLANFTKETNVESGNNSNIQIKHMESEIISDTTENSEVYYNNNSKVLSEDAVMTNAPINDDCYLVLVIGDEENRSKLDVISNTVNDSLSEEDTKSLAEVAAAKKAKKVTIRKVGASCEQGNRRNTRAAQKQKTIAIKEKGLSVAEISVETGKSFTLQNTKTINRLNNQLTSSLSSKRLKPIAIQDKSPPTCNVVKDDREIFLTEDITHENDDGFNDPGVNDPGFDGHGFDDDEIVETVFLNYKDETSEEEYVLSNKENYSSDDSYTAEKSNAKNTRKRKETADKNAKRVKEIKDPTDDDLEEPFFTITVLTLEEQIAEVVERQESSNYINSVFKCTKCFKGFKDEDAYDSHMLRHTDQCGEHECEICKIHFKHPNILRKHIAAHHTQRYSCKQCTFVTKNRHTATLHARWHKGTKYRCPHCSEEFAHHSTYMGHLRVKHPSDFACEICGYSFVSAKGLGQHKNLKHPFVDVQIPEDGPLCELCNVRFISSEAHKRHLSVSARHNTDKGSGEPNQPKNEHKRWAPDKDGDIAERRRTHPSKKWKVEGPIPCEQCGVQLVDLRAYHTHFRRAHPDKNRTNYPSMRNPCMCEVCGKLFQCYTYLKDHKWIHKSEPAFNCESCGKSFRTKANLMMHQRLHSLVRVTYECSICGKHFNHSTNRRRHMLIHTGVRAYKCDLCGKSFKRPGEKQAHVNYVHLKKPWPKRTRGKRRSETRQAQR